MDQKARNELDRHITKGPPDDDPTPRDSALVVLSGGQDSTTCLFWALSKFPRVAALCINYGQRHAIEIESARNVADIAKVELVVLNVPGVLDGMSPLVDSDEEVEQYASADVLPGGIEKTFVPMRNTLFLAIAANYAVVNEYQNIVTGLCQEDFGGYPDCRREYVDKLELAFNSGLEGVAYVSLLTPLMYLTKKQTVEMASAMQGDVWEALSYSHTCYNGAVPPCGHCHACLLRSRGFEEAGFNDPLIERTGQPEDAAPVSKSTHKRIKSQRAG